MGENIKGRQTLYPHRFAIGQTARSRFATYDRLSAGRPRRSSEVAAFSSGRMASQQPSLGPLFSFPLSCLPSSVLESRSCPTQP